MQRDLWIAGITAFIVGLNVLCAVLEIGLLRRRKPTPRLLEIAIMMWAVLMSGLLLLQLGAPPGWDPFLRHWLYLPIGMEMAWNLLFLQVLVLSLLLITLFLRWFRPVASTATVSPEGMARRKFIYLLAYGAAPAAALGLGVHGAVTRYDLRVRKLDLPVVNLPPELEGFTIAHVSDLHSGIFCGPRRLRTIHAAANDLKADLVAITGDIINHAMNEFPAALAAMQGIESRYGIFLCEGNHDCIPGPGLVLNACTENNLPMLFNSSAIIPVRGRRIVLGGLPWMRQGPEGRPDLVSSLYPARQEGDVRILLAHHPHLFDIAESVDLVLSGHTHGGQIMLSDSIGLGPLFFKYWSGVYHRNATTLVVSNGCGDWFPCRIDAPAEIGLLRLTRAV